MPPKHVNGNGTKPKPSVATVEKYPGGVTVKRDFYRNPTNIPKDDQDSGWNHILEHHRERNDENSYFLRFIDNQTLERMILETSKYFTHYKIDEKSNKKIYRFLKYDRAIGRYGKDGSVKCEWLVVVAKRNSWIKTAYPVPDKFCSCEGGINLEDVQGLDQSCRRDKFQDRPFIPGLHLTEKKMKKRNRKKKAKGAEKEAAEDGSVDRGHDSDAEDNRGGGTQPEEDGAAGGACGHTK